VSRKHQRSFPRSPWRAWFLFLVALLASVRPIHGELRAQGLAGPRVPSCCLGEEATSCCPAEERDDSEQTYVPHCCGVESPANAPELAPVPALRAADPVSSTLQRLARAAERVHTFAVSLPGSVHESREHAGLDPPLAPRETRLVSTGHWLTDRGVLAALALLSVSQL
jgi:hypothetical protein